MNNKKHKKKQQEETPCKYFETSSSDMFFL